MRSTLNSVMQLLSTCVAGIEKDYVGHIETVHLERHVKVVYRDITRELHLYLPEVTELAYAVGMHHARGESKYLSKLVQRIQSSNPPPPIVVVGAFDQPGEDCHNSGEKEAALIGFVLVRGDEQSHMLEVESGYAAAVLTPVRVTSSLFQ